MSGSSSKPGSLSALRVTNRRRVVDTLRSSGGLSQAGLVRATGLSAASVSGIVRDLVHDGILLQRDGTADGRRGRVVVLAPERRPVGAGVDLGRTHVRVVIGTGADDVIAETVLPLEVDHSPGQAFDAVSRLVSEACGEVELSIDDLAGVGVGVARPVGADGIVWGSVSPAGWGGLDLADALGAVLGREVSVENDANLGAVAAAEAHRVEDPVVFVKIGHGIGAGIVHRGELVRGRRGFAGDIGHLTLDPRLSTVCSCGRRGCLETVASARAVHAAISAAVGRPLSDAESLDLVRAGHPVALRVLEDAAQLIGQALGWLATVLDPELIVLGGPLASAGGALSTPVTQGFRRAVTDAVVDTPIVLTPFGERTEAIGALLLGLERQPSAAHRV